MWASAVVNCQLVGVPRWLRARCQTWHCASNAGRSGTRSGRPCALAQPLQGARAHGIRLGSLLVRPARPVGGRSQQELRPHQGWLPDAAAPERRGSVFVRGQRENIIFCHRRQVDTPDKLLYSHYYEESRSEVGRYFITHFTLDCCHFNLG